MTDQERNRNQDRQNENVDHDDVQFDVVDDDEDEVRNLGLDNAVDNSSVRNNDQDEK